MNETIGQTLNLVEVIEKYKAYGHPDDEREETSSDAREIWYIALVSLEKTRDMIRHLDYAVRYELQYPANPGEMTPERIHALHVKILAMGRIMKDLGIEPREVKPPAQ